jgi:competence ComEA-like helix-hairpin-helix protein
MQKERITGPVILLAMAAVALIWHISDSRFTPRYHQRNDPQIDFPEQKFLAAGPVDINRATAEELEAIPRIGPSLAKKMIEFRSAKGMINDINELLDIKGIGPRLLTTIGPYLTTEK